MVNLEDLSLPSSFHYLFACAGAPEVAPFSMRDGNTREQAVGVVKEYRLDHTYDLVFSWSHKMSI